MSKEIEVEKTYLAKYLPENLQDCAFKEMEDIYLPKEAEHAHLRIRKNGGSFVITKKEPIVGENASMHTEHTIKLTPEEFQSFSDIDGNRISKVRYYYPYQGMMAEIDIFSGKMAGLVLVDFEFSSREEMDKFEMPDFCLADVTEEEFVAGGVICKHSFDSLQDELEKFGYKSL